MKQLSMKHLSLLVLVVGLGLVLYTPRLFAPTKAPKTCEDLPQTFTGGDLAFAYVCFDQPYIANGAGGSEPYFLTTIAFGNNSSPIPDGLGIHIRVLPRPGFARSYTACHRSGTLDAGSFLGSAVMAGVVIGYASYESHQSDSSLRIMLDPDNRIAETNEGNNIINCTSLEFVDSTEGTCIKWIGFGGSLSLSEGYTGPCQVNRWLP